LSNVVYITKDKMDEWLKYLGITLPKGEGEVISQSIEFLGVTYEVINELP
jgi:hypothetical protein